MSVAAFHWTDLRRRHSENLLEFQSSARKGKELEKALWLRCPRKTEPSQDGARKSIADRRPMESSLTVGETNTNAVAEKRKRENQWNAFAQIYAT
jgi:hypothetical protein